MLKITLGQLLALTLISCGGSPSSEEVNAAGGKAEVVVPAAGGPAPAAVTATDQSPTRSASRFADDLFAPAEKAKAVYRVERDFVEAVMMIEGVPTFDQGMGLKASQTPMDRYTFNYYRLDDDTLGLSVETIVLRDDPSQFIFSGVGIWYDRDLTPTARGQFEGGQLHGEFHELNADGEIEKTILYDKGNRYEPERFAHKVHRPLVGQWVSDTDEGSSVKRLRNIYQDDGTVTIQTIRLNKDAVLGGDDGLREWSRSDPTTWSWTYTPLSENSGNVEYYEGTTLMCRSRLTSLGPKTFESRIVFHRSPSMVGNTYAFRRAE